MVTKVPVRPSIKTLLDLQKALRSGEEPLTFARREHLDAWDTLFKCAGRDGGGDLTAKALRRIEIAVADHYNMASYRVVLTNLPEFAAMCEAAIPHACAKPTTPCERTLSLTVAIRWLREEGIELPKGLNGEGSNVGAETPTSGSDFPDPLTPARQEVWDLLKYKALLGKEIAARLCGSPSDEDLIRKRIEALRKTGRVIKRHPGIGYYRPDAPPPDWTGADRESG